MNLQTLVALLFTLVISGCKIIKPETQHLERNGELILSMERTPCFGRCPVYEIKLYKSGLLTYQGKKFTDSVGCFYRIISKKQISDLKLQFDSANYFSMADKYPEDKKAPTDLPSCILFYNNGNQQKTITDKRWQSPETLTALEKEIDKLIDFQILHFCDN